MLANIATRKGNKNQLFGEIQTMPSNVPRKRNLSGRKLTLMYKEITALDPLLTFRVSRDVRATKITSKYAMWDMIKCHIGKLAKFWGHCTTLTNDLSQRRDLLVMRQRLIVWLGLVIIDHLNSKESCLDFYFLDFCLGHFFLSKSAMQAQPWQQ